MEDLDSEQQRAPEMRLAVRPEGRHANDPHTGAGLRLYVARDGCEVMLFDPKNPASMAWCL